MEMFVYEIQDLQQIFAFWLYIINEKQSYLFFSKSQTKEQLLENPDSPSEAERDTSVQSWASHHC